MRNWMKRAVPAALVAGSLLALAAGTASASSPLPFTPDPAAVLDVVSNGASVLPANQQRDLGPNLLSNVDAHQISLSGQNIGGGSLDSLPKLPVGVPGATGDERSMNSHPGLNILDPAKLAALSGIPGLTSPIVPNIAFDGPLPTNMLGGVDEASQLTTLPGQSAARELPGANLVTTATDLLGNKAPKNGS
jgi:hypothetical protein